MKIWTKNSITLLIPLFFFFVFPLFAGEGSRERNEQASEKPLLVKRLTRLLGSVVHYGGQLRGQTHVFKTEQEFDAVLAILQESGVILTKMSNVQDRLGPPAAEFELAAGILDKRWLIHIESHRFRPDEKDLKQQTTITLKLLTLNTKADEDEAALVPTTTPLFKHRPDAKEMSVDPTRFFVSPQEDGKGIKY